MLSLKKTSSLSNESPENLELFGVTEFGVLYESSPSAPLSLDINRPIVEGVARTAAEIASFHMT
jgi:hypothetical protein